MITVFYYLAPLVFLLLYGNREQTSDRA